MQNLVTCLWFDTQGEEAAEFYTAIFPNSQVGSVSRYGPEGPGPEGQAMTVSFSLDGRPFLALNGGPMFTFSEATSFQIMCKDQDEVDYYTERLTDGGEQGPCAWVKDRFGVSWQVVPTALPRLLSEGSPASRSRVMKAMLTMRKIVIADLETAAAAES